MSVFRLAFTLLALLLCASLFVECFDEDDATRSLVLREFLDRYQPALLVHPAMRRFRRFDYNNFEFEPIEGARIMRKRNNAEVVNHIIKNFGTLDRLGDVGR